MIFFKRHPLLVFPLILIAAVIVLPLLPLGDPTALHFDAFFKAPEKTLSGFLGYDELGRSISSRLFLGMQLSILVGVSVTALAGFIGITIGMLAGWYGKWVDGVLMRITDIFLSFPGILIAIMFAALSAPGISSVVLALGLTGWVTFARLARVQTHIIKQMDYVSAARISRLPTRVILFRHILPNIATPLLVEAIFTTAGAMLAEAGLSFLGIGIQPPSPSLGSMLREGARYMSVAPHLVLYPGLALVSLVLCLTLIGEALRQRIDVRYHDT